ncbi:LytR/AlgR family response regulator transcription factor [Flavihumibacter petaseus]|uniref:Putative two-component response regulator n=1 Tax=Flavihumibacter petaseus NBRC 106054 TaxID=1220578 RepID=A0A0E9MVG9_9BACT|nr:LytTR family DNA-binding domain-containing protein [Flavihumibacter petaseus]GAO41478.1 putative two-component response regulator [Flavihumibacter petaseus NBRC 106054]
MPAIRCIAIDDEPPALIVMEKYIRSVPALSLQGVFTDALESLPMINQQQVDLIFMDIQMPQLLGTDFLRSLPVIPKVIFTTAHRQFALEGFDLDAVDFLLKPIPFPRFLKAVNKVTSLQAAAESTPEQEPASLLLRKDRKMIKVMLQDILYIESIRDYIKVVTLTGTIISKQAISALDQQLSQAGFLRIHRSFLVSVSKVKAFTSELVEIGQTELPISRMYRGAVEKRLRAV